jgi:D-alanyl-D-alanine carboxypeptidase
MTSMPPTTSRRNRRVGTQAFSAVAAGAIAVALLAGCSSTLPATVASGSSTTTTTASTTTTARPEPTDAAALETSLQDLVTTMEVPSAVVLVRSSTFGDSTFTFGTRELGTDAPPTTTDHYRIGSLTKTMTATVILQLADEDKVSLDDPISKYRSGVPNGDNITIADLMAMRSGLAGYDLQPEFLRAVDAEPERIWSPDDVLAIGCSKPLLFEPGMAYDYSNTNYVLLGLVMEQVTGQTATELFQERLFDPLGMDDTNLPTFDDASIPERDAHGYMFASAEKTGSADPALTAEQQQAAADGTLRPADWTASNPSWGWTAGSVISTADDVATWAEAVVDGRLLSAEMQERRMASYQPVDPSKPEGVAYGYGMMTGDGFYGHAGLIFGYNSQFLRNPDTDTTVVVLTNLTLAPDGRLPVDPIREAVMGHLSQAAATDGSPAAPAG